MKSQNREKRVKGVKGDGWMHTEGKRWAEVLDPTSAGA